HAFGRGVTEPVEPCKARTVAKMEARDRVDRLSARRFCTQVVECGQASDDRAKLCACLGVEVPVRSLKPGEWGGIESLKTDCGGIGRDALKPRSEAGSGR